ncbi:MAG: metallophosphoesterase [Vampirovibrionia bacterium]
MKFAHIADTHIKNLKYHYEYGIVFEKLYKTLKEENVDYIIHCGDIAHTKTQISPEFVEMCTKFFRNLADIAPTYIILGNHDGNLKNSSRQDALTPIAEALSHPSLHLLKDSGEVILDNFASLNVLSVFDEDNWVSPADPEKVNIALYHGSISGVKTDTGYVMTHGEHPIEIFEGHDYAFLGDIHKTNQLLDEEGRIRYCGSTVQQNHGETNDKGYLVWDIKDKENFTCKHVVLENPIPFVTINLTPKGKMPKGVQVPEGCRLRLVTQNNLPLDVMRRATDIAKRRFKPVAITRLNRSQGERGSVQDMAGDLEVQDLRDVEIQEKLIKEYLKEYEVEPDLMDSVLSLNSKYNKIAEDNEEISRNVNWKLQSLEFDNLFNYGGSNSINFSNLNGIVGIFGKNYSGKSSIIDSLLFTMFNSTSKNDRKNLNVINQNKEACFGKATISIGNLDYTIERTATKYIKKLKGETSTEAKTDADFSVYCPIEDDFESLNGTTRNETDKNIRKVFGNLDDFLYSSMASQLDSLSFIKEGSTKRKEILANFLDLKFFDSKYKLASDDSAHISIEKKKLENRDFNQEILELRMDLSEKEAELKQKKTLCKEYKQGTQDCASQIALIKEKIGSIPAEVIDVVKVRGSLNHKKSQMISTRDQIQDDKRERDSKKNEYRAICDFLETYSRDTLYGQRDNIENLRNDIVELQGKLKAENNDKGRNEKRVKLLDGIPCGTSFPTCKFIKDALVAEANIPENQKRINTLQSSIDLIDQQVDSMDPKLVETKIQAYEKILAERDGLSNNITNLDLKVDKNEACISTLLVEIERLEDKVAEYETNKDAIENLESLNTKLASLEYDHKNYEIKSEKCNNQILNLYKSVGSCEEKVNFIEEQKASFEALQKEYSAFDLYKQCMHPNGIAFDVIRKKLPVINEEIGKILSNIVDFEVFFEDDGKRLDIFIKHPLYDARPLEMGSGAEKTISAMAIRLALLSVSSLPKGDIFVLDEPGTALDEENMQGFVDILSIIRSYFKTVLLISHLDTLKDCVDMQITIDKKDGYASVNA